MSNNAGNTLIALIGGIAIGAGIGILFAPEKGEKTRGKLKDGYKETKKDLKVKYEGLTSEMKQKLSTAKVDLEETYGEILSDMSHKTEDVISFLEIKLAELKEQNARLQK
ncbi:YtxH domain-containing protein [Flavobacterium degerlachei]|jgi:gas vesicle protein|uniref:Gas vesicle protein n=1 Tax=Flavobacterium degerlachei TaxID=229203 RepID=A0A1H2QSQ2_9FLAO|nr:YtxH domain-containing protein [Flavobacterium degerlachei]SDW10145.1 Gas vesicle protein [Flavobacterium degerlachei]